MSWDVENQFADRREVAAIRARVGKDRVICGLSGGVDSSVVAAILYKAIGSQLSCIFVDNGLLRKGESDKVRDRFENHFKTDLHVVDAKDRFLDELAGVTEPQQKAKDHRSCLHRSLSEEAESIPDAKYLAQGTLYPDVIESGANIDGPAATIKAHHNVAGCPNSSVLNSSNRSEICSKTRFVAWDWNSVSPKNSSGGIHFQDQDLECGAWVSFQPRD